MITPDTSVVVAAFASWHERHDRADQAIGDGTRLLGHVAAETVSTLTRLPEPFRVEVTPVWEFLNARFPADWLAPDAGQFRAILARAVDRGIAGGAIHDALIAGAAAAAGATLVSLDRRAERTYRSVGARVEMLA